MNQLPNCLLKYLLLFFNKMDLCIMAQISKKFNIAVDQI